jgi:hypothetical protein
MITRSFHLLSSFCLQLCSLFCGFTINHEDEVVSPELLTLPGICHIGPERHIGSI